MNTFIILLRESLEAALIIGIIYTYLNGLGAEHAKKYVWRGLGVAVLVSIVLGVALHLIEESIENEALNNLFEGVMMYMAAGFVLYMVVWMAKNTQIASQLKQQAQQALDSKPATIFGVVFFAVAREGMETAIFLFASKEMSGGGIGAWVGALMGIAVAAGIGYAIFVQGKRIPLKTFFNVSSVVLIFMAAGMVAYGTHEMEECLEHVHMIDDDDIMRPYDILKPSAELPEGANPAFYTEKSGKYYHLLHDKGSVGVFIKAFFGYNSDPNIFELLLWMLTLGGGFFLWNKARK